MVDAMSGERQGFKKRQINNNYIDVLLFKHRRGTTSSGITRAELVIPRLVYENKWKLTKKQPVEPR